MPSSLVLTHQWASRVTLGRVGRGQSALGLGSALDGIKGGHPAGLRAHLACISAALQEASTEHARSKGSSMRTRGGAEFTSEERHLGLLQEAGIFLSP